MTTPLTPLQALQRATSNIRKAQAKIRETSAEIAAQRAREATEGQPPTGTKP